MLTTEAALPGADLGWWMVLWRSAAPLPKLCLDVACVNGSLQQWSVLQSGRITITAGCKLKGVVMV